MIGPSTGDSRSLLLVQQLAAEIRNRRRAAGLSQPELAAVIGYTRQYVSLAERPKRGLASAELVKAIDDALDAEGELLVLRHQADAARKACRPGAQSSIVADNAGTTGREPDKSPDPAEVEKAEHCGLVTQAAAITFGASLDEPVEMIITAADERQVPTRVRAGDVRHLSTAVATLEALDHQAGGGAVRHQALAALRWATSMLVASCTPSVRLDLAATTAHLADLAAWATFDAGYHTSARKLFLLGLDAARQSDDLGVRAHVASGLARQEIHVDNWAGGLELTQLAFTAMDALTPNAMAMLYTVKALAYARKRDAAECQRWIAAATDKYQPDSILNDPPWLRYFTPAKLDGDLANAMYDLALGGADVGDRTVHRLDLIDCLSTAFRNYQPDRARSKAITVTRLSTLLYLEGEQPTADQMAEEAISLAGQVRSARLADDLQVLLRALPPGAGSENHALDLHHRVYTVLAEMT